MSPIEAAIKIQACIRSYAVRRKVRDILLDNELFDKGVFYITNPPSLLKCPLASQGRTRVLLPAEVPIVLKLVGSPANTQRFYNMMEAQALCRRRCYRHLQIPQARCFGNFLIEKRLPILAEEIKENIGLYIDNRALFTEAIKEFTDFICRTHLADISGGNCNLYAAFSVAHLGRYDNVILYIEDGKGKIGLPDLENFYPYRLEWEQNQFFFTCRDAISLFPYHFEEIIEIVKKYDSKIEQRLNELMRVQVNLIKAFKNIYEDHVEFLKRREISFENPTKSLEISPQRKEELKEKMLLEHLMGFNDVLEEVISYISTLLEDKRFLHKRFESISSFPLLASLRTVTFCFDDLINKIEPHFKNFSFKDESEKIERMHSVLEALFCHLAEGKEIAFYSSNFEIKDEKFHYIFC